MDLKHELIIVLLLLSLSQVETVVQKLCQKRFSTPGVTPNIHKLQVFQVFKHVQYFVTCLLLGV